jgi:hypothetical protein
MQTFVQWLSENFMPLLSLLISVIGTPTLAWWFTKDKQNAETKKIDSESTVMLVTSSGQLVDSWQEFADQMKLEYAESTKQNRELLNTNRNLLATNNVLVIELEELKNNMKAYMNGIEQLFEIILVEVEKTNPELAKTSRERFSVVSKVFD